MWLVALFQLYDIRLYACLLCFCWRLLRHWLLREKAGASLALPTILGLDFRLINGGMVAGPLTSRVPTSLSSLAPKQPIINKAGKWILDSGGQGQ